MKRFYNLLIAVLLALVGAQQASAWTVYLDVSKGSLSDAPKIYYWGGESNSWPGSPMTKVATGLYKFTSTGSTPTSCIFCTPESNSSSATKLDTNDLTLTDGNVYQWSGTSNTSGTVSVLFNTTDSYSVSDFNVYFDLSAVSSKYSDPYLYIWNLLGDPTLADGTSVSSSKRYKLTLVTGNIYKLALKVPFASSQYINGIVVSGSGSSWDPQTDDIKALKNGYKYTVLSSTSSTNVYKVGDGEAYTEPVALDPITTLYFDSYTASSPAKLTGTDNVYTYTGALKEYKDDGATVATNGSYCYQLATVNGSGTNYWYYSKDDYGIFQLDTDFTDSWNYASTKQRIRFKAHDSGHYCVVTIKTDGTNVTSLSYKERDLDAISAMTLNGEALTASADGKSFTGTISATAAKTAVTLISNPDSYPYYWTAAKTYTCNSATWSLSTTAGASYNVTVATDGTKVTSVTLDEIKSPITSVTLARASTDSEYSADIVLSSTDGVTFTGTIDKLLSFNGTTSGVEKRSFYISTTHDDNSSAAWGISDNYQISAKDTGVTGWAKNSYVFHFSDNGGLTYGNKYTVTVKLSDDKYSVSSLSISEYKSAITAVTIMPFTPSDATKTNEYSEISLSSADGGATFSGKITVKRYDGSGSVDECRSLYISTLAADGSSARWACSTDDYKVTATDTDISLAKSDSFRFSFASPIKHDAQYTITVKLSDDGSALSSMKIADYVETYPINMPLSAADFKNADGSKKAHYFFVGTRTADWRLLPEWELSVSGTTASLSGRFLYAGLFGIAKVDSYSDYINHRYTLYYTTGSTGSTYYITSDVKTATLSTTTSSGAIRYDNADAYPHTRSNSLYFAVGKNISTDQQASKVSMTDDDAGTETDAYQLACNASPVYLNKLTFDTSSGKITFDCTEDESIIAEHRVFTLVGDGIKYDKEYEFSSTLKNRLNVNMPQADDVTNSPTGVVSGWQNAWISFDPDGEPYIDADGNLLPLTAYDAEWLKAHPVYFYDAANDLAFDSSSITFFPSSSAAADDEYADLYKIHTGDNASTSIGNKTVSSGGFTYKEEITGFGSSVASSISAPSSGWQCYVVNDVWLNGSFKVWSGWSGSVRGYDYLAYSGGKASDTNTTWYSLNGGADAGETTSSKNSVVAYDVTVDESDSDSDPKTAKVYQTKAGVTDGNFNFASMTYVNRVVLWYNATDGFNGSVLQLVRPSYGPNITATVANRNQATIKWWIDVEDNTRDSYSVDSYVIDRYKIVDGVATLDKENVDLSESLGKTIADLKNSSSPLSFIDSDLGAGNYQYKIRVNFTNPTTSNSTTKTATSNTVTVYGTAVPVSATLEQVKDGDNYTFDLKLSLSVKSQYLERAVGESTVADKMVNYIIVVDDNTYNQAKTRSSVTLNGSATSFDLITSEKTVDVGASASLPVGTKFLLLPVTNGSGDTKSLEIVWKNVTPTSGSSAKLKTVSGSSLADASSLAPYKFTVYLVSAESDISDWTNASFEGATVSTDVIAPGATMTLSGFELCPDNDTYYANTADNSWQPSGAVIDNYVNGVKQGTKAVHPVKFSGLNVCQTGGSITGQFASSVLDAYDVKYHVAILKDGTAFSFGSNDISAAATSPAETDYTLTLPVAAGDTPASIAGTYRPYVYVEYAKKEGAVSYVNVGNSANAKSSTTINDGFIAPTVSNVKVAFKNYTDSYWDGSVTTTLGYFAHAAVEFDLSFDGKKGMGYDYLNSYVSYSLQQKACANSAGCYPTSDAVNGYELWKYSFAGSSAANGGAPLNFDFGDVKANDGYSEYAETSGSSWADNYADANNWSKLAVSKGRLAVHLNPAYRYASEPTSSTKPGSDQNPTLSVKILVPFAASAQKFTFGSTTVNKARSQAASATTAIATLESKAYEATVDLSNASIATGIDQISADGAAAQDAVYYNLQGIRVINPAPGQVYIVRRGNSATKCFIR